GLTGTVMQNNLTELYTLLNWAEPNCLGTLDSMRTKYINPIKNGQRRDAELEVVLRGRRASKDLSNQIKRLILRRDKKFIKDKLPNKSDNIIFCPPSRLQVRAYRRILNS